MDSFRLSATTSLVVLVLAIYETSSPSILNRITEPIPMSAVTSNTSTCLVASLVGKIDSTSNSTSTSTYKWKYK